MGMNVKQVFGLMLKWAISFKKSRSLWYATAMGICEMHDRNVLHRDIKSANMVITKRHLESCIERNNL